MKTLISSLFLAVALLAQAPSYAFGAFVWQHHSTAHSIGTAPPFVPATPKPDQGGRR